MNEGFPIAVSSAFFQEVRGTFRRYLVEEFAPWQVGDTLIFHEHYGYEASGRKLSVKITSIYGKKEDERGLNKGWYVVGFGLSNEVI